jgi:pimeloyl-ACP methyl ester carboxylesterase
MVDGLDFRKVSPVKSITSAATPILLIHGLDDSRTPPSQSQKLAAANPRNVLWLVPKANYTGALAAAPDEFAAGFRVGLRTTDQFRLSAAGWSSAGSAF